MCGIAGYYGNFQPELLSQMIRMIRHRGPDDEGIWLSSNKDIGLAHARLSIIDLSPKGRQPMTNEDENFWLTYNGEIYNYLELQQKLKTAGHIFQSKTDSEVLLHLYEAEGIEMLQKINGIFAFAIWDKKREELFIARDPLGVKPIYYSQLTDGFLFASELKAILVSPKVSRQIDIEAVYQYLTYLWSLAPKTMLREVKKLPPGEALIIKDGQIRKKWRWYQFPYNGERFNNSENEICLELAKKVKSAVKRQLVSDVPIGAFLSGGLDSSAVVAMMRQIMPEDEIKCYSIGFENAQTLEGSPLDLPYARKAARHLGVNLQEIFISPDDLIKEIKELLFYLDEPQADPAPINAMIIARKAREDGIKVLLSGAGGDDIFTGYRRHLALTCEKYWSWLPLFTRQWLKKFFENSSEFCPLMRRLKKTFAYADRNPRERLVSYFKWSPENIRWPLLSNELKNNLHKYAAEITLLQSLEEIPREKEALNQMLYLEARHFLADHNLNYTDKTSMKSGVEVRVPLLDINLVEFAAKIPTQMKQNGRLGKAIFKKAMEPYLPKDIIYREKTSFGAPLRKWIQKDLKEMLDDLLSEKSLSTRGLFDFENVNNLIKLNNQRKVDGAYTIFSLVCIELWCRIFIDRPVPTLKN